MRTRIHYAAFALGLAIAACETDAPTGANTKIDKTDSPAQVQTPRTDNILTNIPVTGSGGFVGTLTITRFALDRQTGDLLVSGIVRDADGDIAGRFTNAVAIFQDDVCPILTLDLGPLHLDVLGLVVDLSPILLEVTAVPGPGNLLGNLLCALVGLLDDFPSTLQQILNTISQINALLR